MKNKYLLSVLALTVIGILLSSSVVPVLAKPNQITLVFKSSITNKRLAYFNFGVETSNPNLFWGLQTDKNGKAVVNVNDYFTFTSATTFDVKVWDGTSWVTIASGLQCAKQGSARVTLYYP